jgi:hypothetical protein
MCNFLSAIVTKDGTLLCNPLEDSHEKLIDYFGLNEADKKNNFIQKFVRIEFTPQNNDYFNIDSYVLKVDEDNKPDWFNEFEERITDELKEKIRNMIVKRAKSKALLGGTYLVTDSEIKWIAHARIIRLCNSTVEKMYDNSTVETMWGNSTVEKMWGNSTVKEMRGNSTVKEMWCNSTVEKMYDNSTVEEMWGNSTVEKMYDNSTVKEMWGNSTIKEMWNNSTVEEMWNNSTVEEMWNNSTSPNKPNVDNR